ncbi:MAG TPA: hypothetical protein VF546_02370 [Pyrinomonadaceae bacterium]|jgi:hypothetical protein
MRKLSGVLAAQLLLLCCVVCAQGQTRPPAARKAAAARKQAARAGDKARAQAAARRVWLFMSVSSLFDTNVNHDDTHVGSFGLVPSVGFHFQNSAEKPAFEVEYEVALHRYTHTREFNRVSQFFNMSYRRRLAGRFSARTTGEVSLKGSSEDRDVNNQYSLEQQFQYRLNAATRLQAFAAYRLKRYPLVEQEKNAIDPYLGGKLQQTLAGGREWALSYRYDKNRSRGEKDRYVRRTYEAEFSTPLARARRDLLTVEARYSPRLYARQIKVNGARVPRRDQRWVLDVSYERPLRRDTTLGLNYKFEHRASNDPDKRFNAHLFGVTIGFKWWKAN